MFNVWALTANFENFLKNLALAWNSIKGGHCINSHKNYCLKYQYK